MATVSAILRRAVREPLTWRTWREFLFLLVQAPLALTTFVWLIIACFTGVALLVTVLGIPLLALVPLVASQLGRWQKWLISRLLQQDLPPSSRFEHQRGLFGWLSGAFTYGTGWRAAAHILLQFPLAMTAAWAAIVVLAAGLTMATYPVWWSLFATTHVDLTGAARDSGLQIGQFYFDTWPRAILLCLAGISVLCATPWVMRGFAQLEVLLAKALLSERSLTARVQRLERSRSQAVEDAAATLRRVERDLHDGVQALLVSIAMKVGEAKEHAEDTDRSEEDERRLRFLLNAAHIDAKESIRELREVVRGIHPPILDSGLAPAVETLASRSTIPVSVNLALEQRPSVAVESIAYFCVAELLTNVTKHSGASRASVEMKERADRLLIQVTDNGVGGAVMGAGSGLTGLANRVETVDGTISIESPDRGPTVIAINLPVRS